MTPGLLLKFVPNPYPVNRPIKLYFGDGEDLVHCTYYRSRSGLHWDICYRYSPGWEHSKVYTGIVRKLYTVAKFRPLRKEDLGKPIWPEGKNVIGQVAMDEAFEKFEYIAKLLGESVMIHYDVNEIEIFLYTTADRVLPISPMPLLQLGNAYLYAVGIDKNTAWRLSNIAKPEVKPNVSVMDYYVTFIPEDKNDKPYVHVTIYEPTYPPFSYKLFYLPKRALTVLTRDVSCTRFIGADDNCPEPQSKWLEPGWYLLYRREERDDP